jgi:hypothetical protein
MLLAHGLVPGADRHDPTSAAGVATSEHGGRGIRRHRKRTPVQSGGASHGGPSPRLAGGAELAVDPDMNRRALVPAIVLVLLAAAVGLAGAQTTGCPKAADCPAAGRGMPGGPGGPGMDGDHAGFHFLLQNHDRIRRQVKELPDGVETVTESDDPEVAAAIREHVAAMARRLKEGRPIHARDPLFAEIFRHADAIVLVEEPTEKGIRVRETSPDPYVAELIRAHAAVVDAFVARGMAEMHRNHAVPERPPGEPS